MQKLDARDALILALLGVVGCSSSSGTTGSTGAGGTSSTTTGGVPPPTRDGEVFGDTHAGNYNLGPVDFAETQWHNACAPYPARIQEITGPYLAGVDNSLGGDGSLCDACALVTTRLGTKLMVRIVTFGVSQGPGDMDVSPEAFAALSDNDPQGRPMTWQLAKCTGTNNMFFQYQTGANIYWTSLWVRNGKLPIDKLEVKSANHASFFALQRGTDGTFTDGGGFGNGGFELQVTGRGGQVLNQSFPGFTPGDLVESTIQF
jgi:hypothetical protein